MTPKEKAIELIETFLETIPKIEYGVLLESDWKSAKKFALIAVDEILRVIDRDNNYQNVYAYFLEVKQEIQKL